jgi:hypothetical protein
MRVKAVRLEFRAPSVLWNYYPVNAIMGVIWDLERVCETVNIDFSHEIYYYWVLICCSKASSA